MNANEWAEMTKLTSEVMQLIEKNRQQAAEIEALKTTIQAFRTGRGSKSFLCLDTG
jgi:hypothetical protein